MTNVPIGVAETAQRSNSAAWGGLRKRVPVSFPVELATESPARAMPRIPCNRLLGRTFALKHCFRLDRPLSMLPFQNLIRAMLKWDECKHYQKSAAHHSNNNPQP